MKEIKVNNKAKYARIIYIVTVCYMVIYLGWRVLFSIPFDGGWLAALLGMILVVCETVAFVEVMNQYSHAGAEVLPDLPDIPESWYPDVDVFIATHNEDVELLYKTGNACTYLDYPDKSKVHIYFCDDGNRPAVAELASKLGVGYFGLANNKLAKAGNLNNALSLTNSPLVVTFDADMIPQSKFLMRTVPYFFLPRMKKDEQGTWLERPEDEIDPSYKIGFIQTPQSFYNPDLFQYNLYSERRIPNEQDYFFREINVGRNSVNAPIYAGSNTVISRRALEEVGGIATGTITEDFETGLNIQRKGYLTFAVPEVLAQGLAPSTIKSLISQRERWGRGCIQSLRKVKLLSDKELPRSTKISYFVCFLYWWAFFRRFIYTMSPILFAVFNMPIVSCQMWEVLVFWAPSYLLYNYALRSMSGRIRNQHWSNVIDTIIFPYMVLPILMEAIGIKQKKFVVTSKAKGGFAQDSSFLYVLPHAILLTLSLLGLAMCVQQILKTASMYNIIIVYWLIVNIKNLVLAVFFMHGRDKYRQAERFSVQLPISVQCGQSEFLGTTNDISDTGISFWLDRPEFIPFDRPVKICISTDKYSALLSAHVTNVHSRKDKWRYSVQISEMEERDMREYMQIVYDRINTLPSTIDASVGVYDDFYLNITNRVNDTHMDALKLATINVNVPAHLNGVEIGRIQTYSYQYVEMTYTNGENLEKKAIDVEIEPGICLRLHKTKASADSRVSIYYIENWEHLIGDPRFLMMVDTWIEYALQAQAKNDMQQSAPSVA